MFYLPSFFYFKCGNSYTGSIKEISYKIENSENLHCFIWHGRLCSTKAEIAYEQSFEKTEDGFNAMKIWMEKTYKTAVQGGGC